MNSRPSDAILERLLRLHPKLIDLSLHRIERLLSRLGRPDLRLPPVVHVAGTNGKGSVIAFLAALLEAAGYRVHAYTSPHLVRFHERICLAGRPIAEKALVQLLEECETANNGELITFFEITTAAAYLAFARTPADIALVETGLGGRYDATNVFASPALTVLTPIAVDHTQHLGPTTTKIAREKAGILKPGVGAVVGPQSASARRVLERRARELDAPLYRHGTEWFVDATADGMIYRGQGADYRLPTPIIPGRHQIDNAGIALACVEMLDGFSVGAKDTRRGLLTVHWPGRLQRLTRGPLLTSLPASSEDGWELWLDGGHNAHAAKALARTAEGWRDRPLYLIVGMLNSKNPGDFLCPLSAFASDARTVAIDGTDASLSAETLAAAAREQGIDTAPAANVTAALEDVVLSCRPPGRVLICGSLYLVGSVLAENG